MMRRNTILMMMMGLLLLAFTSLAAAQQSMPECPAFVETAFSAAGANCAIAERGTACYGHPLVEATNLGNVVTPNFARPSDRAELLGLESLTTSPFDMVSQTWGFAVTNIQANLPVALAGPGGVLVSMGDVRLENGVMPQEAVQLPLNPLVATTIAETADIFNVPPGFAVAQEVVASAPAGTLLQADAVSLDGQWLRVYYEYETELAVRADAWINVSAVTPGLDVSSLPQIGPNSHTPMQKFYLDNSNEEPGCLDALPPFLYVQGPEEIEMDIVVNDAVIRISSSAFIRVLPANLMEVIALTGLVVLSPDTPDQQILAPGFFSTICLEEDFQNLGIDGQENDWQVGPNCRWTLPAEVPDTLLTRLYDNFNDRLPDNILNYSAEVPRRVCVSGVGGPVCVIVAPLFEQRLRRVCQLRGIERSTCQALGFPWGR